MQFTRAIALVGCAGVFFTALMTSPVRAEIPKGADVPKEPPQPETFLVFDAITNPSIRNLTSSGVLTGVSGRSFDLRGAAEFSLIGSQFDFELHSQRYAFRPVPNFTGMDSTLEAHVNMQVHPQKIYAGIGYVGFTNNYNFPRLGGLGIGVSKLPVLERKFSFSGELWYYPSVRGYCGVQTCSGGAIFAYHDLEYGLGATYGVGSRLFLNADYDGDYLGAKAGTPGNISHSGARAGMGVRL